MLYRQECFSGKKTTRKVHTKLHPELEWRIFHILTSEDIDDAISRFYTVVCAKILLSIELKEHYTVACRYEFYSLMVKKQNKTKQNRKKKHTLTRCVRS